MVRSPLALESVDAPSGSRIPRDVLYNLIGFGAPILAALFATPRLMRGLGIERFGLLTLVWALVGYAGIFDLGLGRAVTQIVAERLGRDRNEGIGEIFWTAMTLMTALGAAAGIALAASSGVLVRSTLGVPDELRAEMKTAILLVAASLPIIVTTTGARGVLEAERRFRIANIIRLGLGVFTFLGPLAVLPFSRSLSAVVAALVVGRLLGWVAYLAACFKETPSLAGGFRFRRSDAAVLLRFGGWMTVSNVISPLLVNVDRFVLGGLLAASVVAYYTTPFEIVSRLSIVPVALSTVLFPAFSSLARTTPREALELYRFGIKVSCLVLVPLCFAVFALSRWGLSIWLGEEFAMKSYTVARTLSVAFLFNGVAAVPFALIQGAGRPDLTAKIHIIELPLYAIALVTLVKLRGLTGAADAWLLRSFVDALLLIFVARRLLRQRQAV